MGNLQIRVDDSLKTQAQAVAVSMGMDLPSAVRIFLTQMVRDNALPFRPTADPFYSASNQAHLAAVADDLKHGRNCAAHELIED